MVASAKVTVTLAPFAARNSRSVRHKRSINTLMAMAIALSSRLCGLLQAEHVNEGCLNSVKSAVETPTKTIIAAVAVQSPPCRQRSPNALLKIHAGALACWQPFAVGALRPLLRNAQVGEVLRNRAEHTRELNGLLHVVEHRRLAGARLQQREIAVDHAHGVELDVGRFDVVASLAGARVDRRG